MNIETKLSLPDYSLMAAQRCCHGPCEGESLPLDVLLNCAPHPYGWDVDGFEERQWLAAYCPVCGYWNSFWQLGIPGSLRPAARPGQAQKPHTTRILSSGAKLMRTSDPERTWMLGWTVGMASLLLGLLLTNVALDRRTKDDEPNLRPAFTRPMPPISNAFPVPARGLGWSIRDSVRKCNAFNTAAAVTLPGIGH
jgi:hypothetical protein